MNNRRTGKIARLPHETRSRVNAMLRDGRPYAEIIAWLEAEKFPGVAEQNLTNWKDGGHQDWLKEQERLEDMQAKREFALEIVKANEGSKIHEATLHLAASQIYEALTDFDLSALKDLLAEKPENYAQIVNGIAKLSKGALDLDRFKATVRERDERIQAELNRAKKNKGGLTAETIERIESELKLL